MACLLQVSMKTKAVNMDIVNHMKASWGKITSVLRYISLTIILADIILNPWFPYLADVMKCAATEL